MSEKPDAYGVWDTKAQCWWKRKGKVAWGNSASAKNAWLLEFSSFSRPKAFADQERYVVKPVKFVEFV